MNNNICDLIEDATRSVKPVVFLSADSGEYVTSWLEVFDQSIKNAAYLQNVGIEPKDNVAVLGLSSFSLVSTVLGVWLTGASLTMLPLPLRLGSIEEFISATIKRLKAANAKILILDDALEAFLPKDGLGIEVHLLSKTQLSEAHYKKPNISADDLAIVQFTSGSTSDPKGVMITHKNLMVHLDSIVRAAAFDPESDVVVSWLPLYHDMGLIGLLLTPMATGASLVQARPQDFLSRPLAWAEWISKYKGTATAGPNFSYALLTRALRRAGEIDLSSLRIALNGAEPVNPDSVEEFLASGKPFGLDSGAAFCAFGMAEATLAVSFPIPGTGMELDELDRDTLENDYFAKEFEGVGRKRRLAKLGYPIDCLSLRIVDPVTGEELAERFVGEIEIKGDSVTKGYFHNDEATKAAFRDLWLRTGDLGYKVDGQLVACGRIKDVIIVGGRNIFPEDIELAAAKVPGVRPGNAIAFGVFNENDKEQIVLVAEVRDENVSEVRKQVAEKIISAIGVPAKDIVLIQQGTLPKTSSGKLQRALCKQWYLSDRLVRA
jgi:fatty-acyl-CoA synthase